MQVAMEVKATGEVVVVVAPRHLEELPPPRVVRVVQESRALFWVRLRHSLAAAAGLCLPAQRVMLLAAPAAVEMPE
jgi:hypothetical protein